jgi:hypothetical protein
MQVFRILHITLKVQHKQLVWKGLHHRLIRAEHNNQ